MNYTMKLLRTIWLQDRPIANTWNIFNETTDIKMYGIRTLFRISQKTETNSNIYINYLRPIPNKCSMSHVTKKKKPKHIHTQEHLLSSNIRGIY